MAFDKSKPEIVELPVTPIDENRRRAVVDLELDAEGRVQGSGSLELDSHHAWRFLRWKDDPEATVEAWSEHLEERFEGFDVSDVVVEEDVRRQHLRVGWSMRQRDEEVLGDEATIVPSRPLTTSQPFTLPPDQRRTPVQMSYGLRDDLVATLSWPKPWKVDVLPVDMSHGSPAGRIECRVERDESQGRVIVRRRFELAQREFFGREGYAALRELYEQTSKADSQGVVLVRE